MRSAARFALLAIVLATGAEAEYDAYEGLNAPTPERCARNKTLLLLRHAEGHHNADEVKAELEQRWRQSPRWAELRRQHGIAWMLLEEVSGRKYHDPLLTRKGRQQCRNLHTHLHGDLSSAAVDLVAVSPMRRTIQTALLALPSLEAAATSFGIDGPAPPPIVATDLLRERVGICMCDSRLRVSELRSFFGRLAANASIDFGEVDEEDTPFLLGASETGGADQATATPEGAARAAAALDARAARALDWLMSRPDDQQRIALVSHRHFLEALTRRLPSASHEPFENAEARTLLLCEMRAEGEAARRATPKGSTTRVRVQPLQAGN